MAVNGSPNALVSYLGNGDGTFTLKSTTPTPNSGGWVVLADINNDGKLDFATSGNLLALGNGDGTFQIPAAIVDNPPPSGFSGIVAGDINNDGWPDLVLTPVLPMSMLPLVVVMLSPPAYPIPMLLFPVVLFSANAPTAVLFDPVLLLFSRASKPMAVLLAPVVAAFPENPRNAFAREYEPKAKRLLPIPKLLPVTTPVALRFPFTV